MRIKGFDEIQEQIDKHPGKLAHDEWFNLGRTFDGIYKVNRKVLIQSLEEPARNDKLQVELIQNVRLSDASEKYNILVIRNLHNYVASFKTMVDYARRLGNKYTEDQLTAYFKKKDKLVEANINAFVNDLRNYLLHYDVPPLISTFSFTKDSGTDFNFSLSSEKLLKWSGWSKASRQYIKVDEKVDILRTIVVHGEKVDDMFVTLLGLLPELHGKDIEDVNKLVQRRNDILSGRIKVGES